MRNAKRGAAIVCFILGWPWMSGAGATVPPGAEPAVTRVLTLLNVVGEEYREGVRDGQITLPIEYREAGAFLDEAQQRLSAVPGVDAAQFTAAFDGLRSAWTAKAPLDDLRRQLERLSAAVTAATGVSEAVFPDSAPSASRGRVLFAENCAPCHGEGADGRGKDAAKLQPPPASFTDSTFMRAETPFDFFHVMTVGKGTSAMPAWGDVLSLQERWDLVSYLWSVRHGKAGLAEGQGIFLTQCAGCHGAIADGRGTYSDRLLDKVAPLDTAQTLARRSDSDLFAAVANGIPDTAMPSFARTLTEDQIWSAVAFLRMLSLGGDDGTSPAAAGNDESARRLVGLLGLLAEEYRKVMSSDADASKLEVSETLILLDQAERQAEAVRASVPGLNLTDGLRSIRGAIERRAAAADVTALTSTAAQAIEARLPDRPGSAPVPEAKDAVAETRRLLDEALVAYGRNDTRATYMVSDAYFQFEPLEKKLAGTAPELTRQIEGLFLDLRTALGDHNPDAQAKVRALTESIGRELDQVEAILHSPATSYGLAVQSATVILREGFEVVLIVGALLAYVLKAGQPAMRRAIWYGAGAGLLASLATAYGFVRLLRAAGVSVEVLEGMTMLLAAAVLFSVSYWLISKAEADKWQRYIQGKVSSALKRGSGLALGSAAFLAVYREGVETVLFYDALSASSADLGALASGFAVGCALLVVLYVAFQRLGKRVPIRQFFLATGGLLYYLAFVFAGKGVRELQAGSWVGITPVPGVPTIDFIGVYPSAETLIVQALLLACVAYAVFITVRSRSTTDRNEVLLAELRDLKQIAQEIQREVVAERRSAADEPEAHKIELLISRVSELENQMSFHFRGNGKGKAAR